MTTAKAVKNVPPHPMDGLLRTERIPHIWCPGCGIGTVFSAVLAAIKNTGWDPNTIAMVSGIGCTGRMAGYIRLDSFHTTHGRALPFATGLKLAKPDTKVIIVSGDGDLF
ncbi:MAG TPA: thiamine pyrophosphate-dependent enzyme, partial [Smithellaceae bacterium]|nr:thiamine pyrophosphate-dependent enzyme [Smithellaceae bacterium]